MNILVIEDERKLADAIVRILQDAGYQAEAVYDGQSGLTYAESGTYGLVVLDRMLEGMDGIELLKHLRQDKISIPVLMLTARTSTEDKVEGLDAGADDYLTKPFEKEEFLARIRALVRRQGEMTIEELTFGDLTLDLATHDLSCGDKSVHLSGKEFQVLELLIGSSQRVVSKQDLLARVWGADSEGSENSAEAYISFLRKKLAHIDSRVQITTLRMLGYRLEMFNRG